VLHCDVSFPRSLWLSLLHVHLILISHAGISLLWVAILFLVVLYIYSVVSFAFLHESFLKEDNDDADLFCNTLFECLISVLRYGLIDNLGLVHQFDSCCMVLTCSRPWCQH